MKLKSFLAIAVAAAFLPVCAHAQAPKKTAKATNADAKKVVQIISGDKAKMQAFCDLDKLSDEMNKLDENKDKAKIEAMSKQADALSQKIGPEYAALMDGFQALDEKSKEAQDISATLGALDEKCPK